MDKLKIGLFLLRLREEKHMTQDEVGEYVGVSNKAVSKWETGEGLPNYEALMALSTLYGVTVNEILNGERNANNAVVTEQKQNKPKSDTATGYYTLSIVALVLFSATILAILVSNMAGNLFIGTVIAIFTFIVGGACYGCSYIFKKRSKGLITANHAVGIAALGCTVMGIATLPYWSTFDFVTIGFWSLLVYLIGIFTTSALFGGIFTHKSLSRGLSLKEATVEYSRPLTASWLFGLTLFFIIQLIVVLAEADTGVIISKDSFVATTVILIVVTLASGFISLKFRLGGLICAYAMVVAMLIYYSGTQAISYYEIIVNNIRYRHEYNYYRIEAIMILIYSCLYAAITTISYVFYRQKSKENNRSIEPSFPTPTNQETDKD